MPSLLFEQFTSRRRTGQPMRRPSHEKVRPAIVEDLKIRSRRHAFVAAKALQHDADLALRRRMPPRRGGCPSQIFPPAPSPAPGVSFISRSKKDLWAAPPM